MSKLFKRTLKPTPLTKGAALIQAREILGPDAHVTNMGIITPGAVFLGDHQTALDAAKESPQAAAWENYKEGRRNDFLDAVNSLRDTARALLGDKKLAQHLTKQDHRFIRSSLGNLA